MRKKNYGDSYLAMLTDFLRQPATKDCHPNQVETIPTHENVQKSVGYSRNLERKKKRIL